MEKSVSGFVVSFAGINPQLIPFRIFLFLSQKRIRVISRNYPILDFTKEMHPMILFDPVSCVCVYDCICVFSVSVSMDGDVCVDA